MADKSKELSCLSEALMCKNIKGKYGKEIRDLLLKYKDYSIGNCERPDFVFMDSEAIIGIEHFQVDELFKIKKHTAQSLVGKQNNEINSLVEKYKDEDLLEKDIKNGNAMATSLNFVKEQFDAQNEFDYLKFIKNFERISQEHNNNGKKYLETLTALSDVEIKMLGCLIEVPYIKVNTYIVSEKHKERLQAVQGIPITMDILLKIEKMTNFGFVILYMHALNEDGKSKNSICYYLLPKKLKAEIDEHYIKPFDSFRFANLFGLPFKTEVEFPRDSIKNEDGNITYTAKITKKNK